MTSDEAQETPAPKSDKLTANFVNVFGDAYGFHFTRLDFLFLCR
jgi:hypothetical protein